jgi:TadE-like protein
MKRFSPKNFLKAEGGIAAIEMAFILPLMLFLYFGLIDLTSLVSFNRKVTAVASATADLVGQNRNSVLKTDIVDYFKVAGMIMKPTPDSLVKVRVFGYRKVGTAVNKMWTVDNGKGLACSTEPSTTALLGLMVAGNDLVVAQTCMKFEPYIGTFLGEKIVSKTNFDVEQVITVRPRSSLLIDCYVTTVGGSKC